MEVLRARLLDLRLSEQEAERSRMRRTQVGTGDRSAKMRTYNYPQSRVTDHRIGYTTHNLAHILDGDLNEVTEALQLAEVEGRMRAGRKASAGVSESHGHHPLQGSMTSAERAPDTSPATVADLVREAAERLAETRVEQPRQEARDLIAAILDAPRFWSLLHSGERPSPELTAALDKAISRRVAGAPFAYAAG